MNEIRELQLIDSDAVAGTFSARVTTKDASIPFRGRWRLDRVEVVPTGSTVTTATIDACEPENEADNYELARLNRLPVDPLYALIEARLAESVY